MSSSGTLHPAAIDLAELLSQCDQRRTRRGGPGGQHRNKVETAVILTHRPTGILAEANERRSQIENRNVALRRLRMRLAIEWRVAIASPFVPTPLWQSRCQARKIVVSKEHDDFPAMLAEALDFCEHVEMDMRSAAKQLGCTTSQLVKFIKADRHAWASFTARRIELGLPALK